MANDAVPGGDPCPNSNAPPTWPHDQLFRGPVARHAIAVRTQQPQILDMVLPTWAAWLGLELNGWSGWISSTDSVFILRCSYSEGCPGCLRSRLSCRRSCSFDSFRCETDPPPRGLLPLDRRLIAGDIPDDGVRLRDMVSRLQNQLWKGSKRDTPCRPGRQEGLHAGVETRPQLWLEFCNRL